MTNDEIKKEVLSRAHRRKKNKAKRNKQLFVGGVGLLCLSLSALLLPTLTLPSVVTSPDNGTQTNTSVQAQTVTTHITTKAVSSIITSSQTTTPPTDTKHSDKSPHYPSPTTIGNAPLSNGTLVLEDGTIYRLATDEELSRYNIPQPIQDKNIGEYLGTVETRSDAPIYSTNHALAGGKVHTYKPVADEMVLVILCHETKLVFIISE